MATANRIEAIEGMRGIAALYVALGHVATMVDPLGKLRRADAQPEWLAALVRPLWFGHLAVAAFIVISGFCLQWALSAKGQETVPSYSAYMRRRSRRILPPYYACLALSVGTCYWVTQHQTGLPWSQYVPVTTENLLAHLGLIHNWRPEWMYKINGVLWSIAIEFQIYFLFPGLARSMRGQGKYLVPILVAVVCALVLWMFPESMKLYVWYLPLFAVGMLGAKIATGPSASSGWWTVFGSILLITSGWLASNRKDLIPADIAVGMGSACWMIAVIGSPTGAVSRFFGLRGVTAVGAFSYSLYLMHHPVLQWMYVFRPVALADTVVRQFAWMWGVAIPVALVICYGFYLVFERPFIRAAKSKPVTVAQ